MAEVPESFAAQLRALREAFLRDLPGRLAEIQAAWAEAGLPLSARIQRMHAAAHQLAGTAGTFGFTELGQATRDLDNHLKTRLGAEDAPSPDPIPLLLEALRVAVSEARLPEAQPAVTAPAPAAARPSSPDQPEVFLLHPSAAVPDWVAHLRSFGFPCRSFDSFESFRAAVQAHRPSVAVVDDAALPGDARDLGILASFQGSEPIPLVMLSEWPSLESRIQAVRAGCRAFLPKPPDLLALVEAVELHLPHAIQDPIKVLVVEDEPLQSRHHLAVLHQAGMKAIEVNDPFAVMGPLVDGRPDLILLDVYMPGCTGVELAMAIRQQEAFVGIPIVFVSQEKVRSRQLDALRKGGDDFLTKPVDPEDLASIVEARALRGRVLRSHMVRDSLTGLLNHSSILDHLKHEVARVERAGEPLAFAMIDLDEFKSVNDRFGHPAGDRVLRSLAHMLSQRLRKSDLVGRYGGEEFAVILPGASAESAASLLDDIREAFAALEFLFGAESVRVTFSAGLAEFPRLTGPEALTAAADEALYRAKHAGRNRVARA